MNTTDIDTLFHDDIISINGNDYYYTCVDVTYVNEIDGKLYNYNVFKKILFGLLWWPVYNYEDENTIACEIACKEYLKKIYNKK